MQLPYSWWSLSFLTSVLKQIQLSTHWIRPLCVWACGSVHFVDGCWGRTLLFSTWGRGTTRWEWWSFMIRAFFKSRWAPRRLASVTESPSRTSAGRQASVLIIFTFCCDGTVTHLCWLHSYTDYLCGVFLYLSRHATDVTSILFGDNTCCLHQALPTKMCWT